MSTSPTTDAAQRHRLLDSAYTDDNADESERHHGSTPAGAITVPLTVHRHRQHAREKRERPLSMPPVGRTGNSLGGDTEGGVRLTAIATCWPPTPGEGWRLARPVTASPSRSFISPTDGQIDLAGFNFALASPDDLRRALHQSLSDLTAVMEERDLERRRNQQHAQGTAAAGEGTVDAQSSMAHELSQTARRVGDLKRMLSESDHELAEARSELARVRADCRTTVERLTADTDTLTDTLQHVTEDLAACREELRESRDETENVRAWLEGAWADRERLMEGLAQLADEYPELADRLARLTSSDDSDAAGQVMMVALPVAHADDEDEEEELNDEVRALIGLRSQEEMEQSRLVEQIRDLEAQLNSDTVTLTEQQQAALEQQLAELHVQQGQHSALPAVITTAANDRPKSGIGNTISIDKLISPRHQRTMSEIDCIIAELETDLTETQYENSLLKSQLDDDANRRELEMLAIDLRNKLRERDTQLAQVYAELEQTRGANTATPKASSHSNAAAADPLATPRAPNDSATLVPREMYDDLEERRALLDIRCSEQEIAIVGLEEERGRWSRERSEMEEEIRVLEQQRTATTAEHERLCEELTAAEEKLRATIELSTTFEREMKQLREEKEQLEARIAAATRIDLDKADDSVLELDPEWRLRIQLLHEEKVRAEQQATQAKETLSEAQKLVEEVQTKMRKLESEKRMLVERLAVVHRRQAENAVAAASSSSSAASRSAKRKNISTLARANMHQRTQSAAPATATIAGAALSRGHSHNSSGSLPAVQPASTPPREPAAVPAKSGASDSPLQSLERYRRRIEQLHSRKLSNQHDVAQQMAAEQQQQQQQQSTLVQTVRELYRELDDRDRSIDELREQLADRLDRLSDVDEDDTLERQQQQWTAHGHATRTNDTATPPAQPLKYAPGQSGGLAAQLTEAQSQVAELRREVYALRGERETLRVRVNRTETAMQDARDRADDCEEEVAVLRGNISAFMDRARNIPDVDRLLDPELTHPLLAATDDLIARLQQELSTLRVEKDAIGMELEEGLRHCYEEAAREIEMRDEEQLYWQQRCSLLEDGQAVQPMHAITAATNAGDEQARKDIQTLRESLGETLRDLDAHGLPLRDHWLRILESRPIEKPSTMRVDANATMGDVTWLRDMDAEYNQRPGVAQSLQTQLDVLQNQLDVRTQELEQTNLQLIQAEQRLHELDEKVQELEAGARVAEGMTALVREELVRKERELDAVRMRQGSDADYEGLESRLANTSINLEQSVDAVLARNAKTLVELDRLCRIASSQQKQLQQQQQQRARLNAQQHPTSHYGRSISRSSSGGRDYGSVGRDQSDGLATGQSILQELREYGLRMREWMEEHAALKQHISEHVDLYSAGPPPPTPQHQQRHPMDLVTVDRLDLKAFSEVGDAMTQTTTAFLYSMEKLAPRLLHGQFDAPSSVTAVEESNEGGSRPVSAQSSGRFGDAGVSVRDLHMLRERLTRTEDALREERTINQQLNGELDTLENTLAGERQDRQNQLQLRDGRNGHHTTNTLQLEQEVMALSEEIADLEARLANEQDLREEELASARDVWQQEEEEMRRRHREDTRKLGLEIRYLQSKCQREVAFRHDFRFQKQYLLLLIGGMESSEQETLRIITEMAGMSPHNSFYAQSPLARLRAAVHAVIAVIRLQNAAESWAVARQHRYAANHAATQLRQDFSAGNGAHSSAKPYGALQPAPSSAIRNRPPSSVVSDLPRYSTHNRPYPSSGRAVPHSVHGELRRSRVETASLHHQPRTQYATRAAPAASFQPRPAAPTGQRYTYRGTDTMRH